MQRHSRFRSPKYPQGQGFIAILSSNTSWGSLPPRPALHQRKRLSSAATINRRSHPQAAARSEPSTSRCCQVNRMQRNDHRKLGKRTHSSQPQEMFCHKNLLRPAGEEIDSVVRSLIQPRSVIPLSAVIVAPANRMGAVVHRAGELMDLLSGAQRSCEEERARVLYY